MACPQFESRIAAYLDNLSSDDERSAVEEHLANCAACRKLAAELRDLDTILRRCIPSRAMSPGFRARLWQRIESEPMLTSDMARAECKRRAQAEFRTQMARFRRKTLHLGRWLDLASLSVALGIAGGLLGRFALALAETVATQTSPAIGDRFAAAAIAGLSLLVIGAGAGLWNSARRTWLAV